MVGHQLIAELKTILKEEYGKDLETKEVSRIANDMVSCFDTLAKIYHTENNQEKDQKEEKTETNNVQKL